MPPREELQTLFESILGSSAVYFQPPTGIQIQYPAIIYKRNDISVEFANNKPYRLKKEYQITVIDKNPDSLIPDKVAALPECRFERNYVVDNLNHDVFTISF